MSPNWAMTGGQWLNIAVFKQRLICPGVISGTVNYDMLSTLVWLAAIQLISYRNSQTLFDDAMICNIITDLKTIRSTYKGFLFWTVGGLFDNPRPPEVNNS